MTFSHLHLANKSVHFIAGDILAECDSNEFTCPTSKLCIPYSQLCNGVQDCGTADNGDEHGCRK